MRLLKDKFYQNFNNDYLNFLEIYYENVSITKIKKIIREEIKTLGLRNSLKNIKERNVDYWLIRGWAEEDAVKKINEINEKRKKPVNNSILTIGYWTSKNLTKEEAISKISLIQKERSQKGRLNNPDKFLKPLSPFTEQFWLKKGIVDKNEIENKIKSQRKNSINYWINKGFGEDEAKKKVSEYQKENNVKRDLKWQKIKNNFEGKKQRNTNIEYYLNKGYSLEESRVLLKERQTTFTLEKCIIKYGLDNGTKIYNERNKKWIAKVFNENTCISSGISILSQKFIDDLIILISDTGITNHFRHGINEKHIYDKVNRHGNKYDLCYNDKIIEFNGDFWHANPKVFEKDEIHKVRKIKCSEIWKRDSEKIKLAEFYNYKIMIIWSSDYISNREEILKKCKRFILN